MKRLVINSLIVLVVVAIIVVNVYNFKGKNLGEKIIGSAIKEESNGESKEVKPLTGGLPAISGAVGSSGGAGGVSGSGGSGTAGGAGSGSTTPTVTETTIENIETKCILQRPGNVMLSCEISEITTNTIALKITNDGEEDMYINGIDFSFCSSSDKGSLYKHESRVFAAINCNNNVVVNSDFVLRYKITDDMELGGHATGLVG